MLQGNFEDAMKFFHKAYKLCGSGAAGSSASCLAQSLYGISHAHTILHSYSARVLSSAGLASLLRWKAERVWEENAESC